MILDNPSLPYALVIDGDDETRKLVSTLLRETGFAVAGFGQSRGALAAIAARPADLAVIAGHLPDGSDGVAAARQLRHFQPQIKILFIATSGVAAPEHRGNDSHVVTRPFNKRWFVAAVLELMARDTDPPERDAELGLVEAQLACLRAREQGERNSDAATVAHDLATQIRDAMAARQNLLHPAASIIRS